MAQVANMGGDVAEPDPMVLKMMIQMVAERVLPSAYVRLCIRHVHRAAPLTNEWIIRVNCFLVFLCALLSGSLQCGSGVNNNVLVLSGS